MIRNIENSCATVALDIKTYHAGQNQVTHPNVIDLKEPWHGYRYYMAYTPYPYENGSEENPSLSASNDLENWETPEGLINPIACCEEVQCDELKDTHLLYRADQDRLEMWYLGRLNATMAENGPLYCFRKVSMDGIKWSDYEIMYQFQDYNLASESVIYQDGLYRFWGIRHDKKDIGLYYMESADGFIWSGLEKCNVPRAVETSMWHGAISKYNEIYYYVWVGGSGQGSQTIYLAKSDDGLNYSEPVEIVKNTVGWSHLYRPSLLLSDGVFYCFYGVVRLDNRWMIAMSRGPLANELVGMTEEELRIDAEHTTGGKKLRAKIMIHSIKSLVIPRLFVIVPILMAINWATKSVFPGWMVSMLMCGVAYREYFDRTRFLSGGLVAGTACMAAATFFYQVLCEMIGIL